MSFWWDYQVTDYLFKGLTAHSVGGLIGMCICVAAMSFTFEFLRYLQARQRQKELMLRSEQLKTICPTETSTLLAEGAATTVNTPPINITMMDRTYLFGVEISLWFSLQNLGYILMLSVMLYNGWLFVSAVLGGGLGYFIFGQMFMKTNLQNCQIIRDTWCMQKCGEPESIAANRDGESTPALETSGTSRSVLDCREVVANVHAECHT
jgi:copper transporter 1